MEDLNEERGLKTGYKVSLIICIGAITILCILSGIIALWGRVNIFEDMPAGGIIDYFSAYPLEIYLFYIISTCITLIILFCIKREVLRKWFVIAYMFLVLICVIFSLFDFNVIAGGLFLGSFFFSMGVLQTIGLIPMTFFLYSYECTSDESQYKPSSLLFWIELIVAFIIVPTIMGIKFWRYAGDTLAYIVTVILIFLKFALDGYISKKKIGIVIGIIMISFVIIFCINYSSEYINNRLSAAFTGGQSDPYGYGYMYLETKRAMKDMLLIGNGAEYFDDASKLLYTKLAIDYPLISFGLSFGIIFVVLIVLAIVGIAIFLLFLSRKCAKAFEGYLCFGTAIYFILKLMISIIAEFLLFIYLRPPFLGSRWQVATDIILFATCVVLANRQMKITEQVDMNKED